MVLAYTGDNMAPSKSRNLTTHERAYVCLKIKELYDQEKGAFCRGGKDEVKKRCDKANIVLSMDTIKRSVETVADTRS